MKLSFCKKKPDFINLYISGIRCRKPLIFKTMISVRLKYQPTSFKDIGFINLKGVFAKNERWYRLNAIKKRF